MMSANLRTNQCIATCPACGLLCDDVLLENKQNKLNVLNNNCAKSFAFFAPSLDENLINTTPKIANKPATLQQAIMHAAKLLKQAKQPAFSGLSTDIAGFRAIYHLAQKTNASLQHANAQSMARNIDVLQSAGWQTTTLTEVKNRADVLVCIGSDIVSHHPRFFERFILQDGMFVSAKQREIIFIGENLSLEKLKNDAVEATSLLPCRAADLPEITLVLRALVTGKQLKAITVAGVKVSDLQSIADKLKNAKYAVLAWVAKDLDFAHAELTIQNMTETVVTLNQTTRAGALPLGGSDGDTSANNANTWLSGLALNDTHIEHDCMLWVNSFSADKLPPKTDKPLIVLGNINHRLEQAPDVFIPIATPGLDCSGTLFRVDSAVVLPLKKVRGYHQPTLALPTLSEVVSEIESLL